MTERRQAGSSLDAEKTQRLHVCSRINELRGNCEHLTRERDELSAKLTELSKIVDTLIDEKRDNRYDPHLEIDLSTYRVNRGGPTLRRDFTTAKKQTNPSSTNLNSSLSSTSTKLDASITGPPSHAFKMKLSQCLEDINPKIYKIATLTDQLCFGRDEP